MLKAIWFLVKLSLLLAVVIWISERPGTVEIEWQDYIIETSVGVLLSVIGLLVLFSAWLYRFWRAFVSVPQAVRRYNKSQSRERGYDAVTKGLVAIAGGDTKMASRHAQRARALLPETSLTRLLTAQSAQLSGDDAVAQAEFTALLEDKNAAFFGIRGLLNQALKEKRYDDALDLVRKAEKMQPRRDWIIDTLFFLETRAKQWESAEQTLSKAVKNHVIDRETAKSHRQVILLARSKMSYAQGVPHQAISFAKKSFKINPSFVPSVAMLVSLYIETNKRRGALKVLEQSWKLAPHASLVPLWDNLIPPFKKSATDDDKKKKCFEWSERLYSLNAHHQESLRVLGIAALKAGKLDIARENLQVVGAYRHLAKLERLEGGDETKARRWMEMAADAPVKSQWVCHECGTSMGNEWSETCYNCHGFNSLNWTVPLVDVHQPLSIQKMDEIIDPPSKKSA